MSTTPKALFRLRVVHWRRKESVDDAKGALPSSSGALKENGECRRREQALHPSSSSALKENGECRRREQALHPSSSSALQEKGECRRRKRRSSVFV